MKVNDSHNNEKIKQADNKMNKNIQTNEQLYI